jgi:hypothetical protein
VFTDPALACFQCSALQNSCSAKKSEAQRIRPSLVGGIPGSLPYYGESPRDDAQVIVDMELTPTSVNYSLQDPSSVARQGDIITSAKKLSEQSDQQEPGIYWHGTTVTSEQIISRFPGIFQKANELGRGSFGSVYKVFKSYCVNLLTYCRFAIRAQMRYDIT